MSSNLTRGSQAKIDQIGYDNGKLRFAIDTGRLFIDTASDRIEITDIVYGLKEAQIIALKSPLPKVYLSSDTYQIMSYDFRNEEWIVYGGGTAKKAECDILNQRIDLKYLKNVKFNENNDIVLTYGNSATETITNPLTKRVVELETKMAKLLDAIDIDIVND